MSSRPGIYPIKEIEPIRQALGSGDETLIDRIRETYLRLERERYEEMLRTPVDEDDEYAHETQVGEFEVDEDELESISEVARSFVEGELVDDSEPGVWFQAIELLALHLGLRESPHGLNEGWKSFAWRAYFDRVAGWLSDGPRVLLDHLVSGRPLKAKALDPDGCMFGWLTSPEVSELLAALRELGESHPEVVSEDFFPDFHADLVKGLAACEGRCLLIGA
jgi:hypothetical protein